MIRPVSPVFLESMVAHAVSMGDLVSVHFRNPGVDGSNEIPVERQRTTWGPVVITDCAQSEGSECAFELPGEVTCTHFGVWSPTGFLYGGVVDPPFTTKVDGGTLFLTPSYQEIPE